MPSPNLNPRPISGGAFQDALGNVLALGYMKWRLNTDATSVNVDSANVQISAGRILTVPLDADGNVDQTNSPVIWVNADMTPSNTVYFVEVYSAEGVLAWKNQMTVPVGNDSFDLGTWTPSGL